MLYMPRGSRMSVRLSAKAGVCVSDVCIILSELTVIHRLLYDYRRCLCMWVCLCVGWNPKYSEAKKTVVPRDKSFSEFSIGSYNK